jgi:membrane protein DedA with SNARE-associated domain
MVSIPLVETVVSLILWILTHLGLPGLVALMIVESFGIPPLPSEIILPFSGFLIATGVFAWGPTVGAALLGGVVGSYIAYGVGRYARPWLLKGPAPFRLETAQLDRVDAWFLRHGEGLVIFGRLVPVIRSYVSYPAGTARMEPARFGVYTLVGATPFTLALLYAGYVLGKNWSLILPYFHLFDDVAVVALVGLGVYAILVWRGRLTSGWPPRIVRPGPAELPSVLKGP